MINKLKKNKKGFTLVELVVVIAILAILAAAAVPAYNGYIARANEAADEAKLSAALTAGTAAANDCDVEFTSISVTNAGVVSVTLAGDQTPRKGTTIDDSLKIFLGNDNKSVGNLVSEKYASGATWTSAAGWVAASGNPSGNS